MTKNIGVCGLDCGVCETYLTTIKNDDEERKKIAKEWGEKYHSNPEPKDINCLGCNSKNGPWYKHCLDCEIRLCGLEKKIDNCGKCEEYPCEKVAKFIDHVPKAKANCEKIKSGAT